MKIEYVDYRPLMTPRPLGYGDMAVFETPHRSEGKEPPFIEVIVGECEAYDPAGDHFFTMRLLNDGGRPESIEMMRGSLVLHGTSKRDRIVYEYLMMHDANRHKRGRNSHEAPRYGLTKVVIGGELLVEEEYDERLWSFYKPTVEEDLDITEAVVLSAEESGGSILLDEEQLSQVPPLTSRLKKLFLQHFVRHLIDRRRVRLVNNKDDGYTIQVRHYRTMTFVTIGRMSNKEEWGVRLAAQLAEADDKSAHGKAVVTKLLVKNPDVVYATCKDKHSFINIESVIATWPDLYEVMVKNSAHGIG